MKLTEFEQLTLNQILIECGGGLPTKQNIIDTKRIVRDCNYYRRFKNLKEF